MIRPRSIFILLALGAVAACDRTDPPTAPTVAAIPHALPIVNVATVSNTNDDGAGSLRKAIADAEPGDVIHFADAIAGQTIILTSGQLVVDKALTIEGSATAGMTISGGLSSRIFSVAATGDLTIRNLTISDGFVAGSGGLGGGIHNDGKLTIENSTIANNTIDVVGTGAGAGGIGNGNDGILTLINSTVTGNRSDRTGGIVSFGSLTLIHTTITNNESTTSGFGVSGGFDAFEGSLTIRSSIIGGNRSEGGVQDACKVGSATVAVGGPSIIDRSGCILNIAIIVADPLLGSLANNGGPTKTHAILMNSPAIDALTTCSVSEDQRHVARPQGAACDIGAYEFSDYVQTPIVVDASVAVNPSTGVAIATGTLSCSAPIDIPLHVELTQPQKLGRATVTAKASGDIVVSCASVKAWSISLVPPTGAFTNGTGTVSAKTTPPGPSVTSASATAAVKLYWAKK